MSGWNPLATVDMSRRFICPGPELSFPPKRIGTGLNIGVGEFWAILPGLLGTTVRPGENSNLIYLQYLKKHHWVYLLHTCGLQGDSRYVLLNFSNHR